MKHLLLIPLLLMSLACAKVEDDLFADGEDAGLKALATQLKSIDDNFVPESMTEDGTPNSAFLKGMAKASEAGLSKSESDDICGDLDFFECQPVLLRFYVRTGRAVFGISHLIVASMAAALGELPDNSDGVFNVDDEETGQTVTVSYVKNSLLDYKLLISVDGQSAGFIDVKNGKYDIQLDIGLLEKNKPSTDGGKLSAQVEFTSVRDWKTNFTITDAKCKVSDPKGPTSVNIEVSRKDGLWNGKAMLYSPRALAADTVTCDDPIVDGEGVAIYADFIADRSAIKAATYILPEDTNSVTNLQSFGIDTICDDFLDMCNDLAAEAGQTLADIENFFLEFANPQCVKRGSKVIEWNSDCSDVSADVAAGEFRDNSEWMTPKDFSEFSIQLPTGL